MKRIILFSAPTENNLEKILKLIFPEKIKNKVLAYMPSDGEKIRQEYVDQWKDYAKKHNAEFRYIDNSKKKGSGEDVKLLESNILVITGGNTFKLLANLRKSGLDKAIREFTKKNEFILAGFSAGALVLTPNINICNLPGYDKNEVGLKDLAGLGILNFEVLPHYSKKYRGNLLEYRKKTKNKIVKISDDDFFVLDRD
jgi:dipeptidase E